jgi:hypothetical protein
VGHWNTLEGLHGILQSVQTHLQMGMTKSVKSVCRFRPKGTMGMPSSEVARHSIISSEFDCHGNEECDNLQSGGSSRERTYSRQIIHQSTLTIDEEGFVDSVSVYDDQS